MPHRIEWEETGAFVFFYGRVGSEELLRVNGRFHADRQFDVARYLIRDWCYSDPWEGGEELAERLARSDSEASHFNKGLRVAHVAKDRRIRQTLHSYLNASRRLGNAWEMRLFDSTEEARSWAMNPLSLQA